MGRFLLRLVTRRWGWTLIAALIVLGGGLWGVSSPTTPYLSSQSSQSTSYYLSAANNGDVYIWTTEKDNPTFYVARHDDFNPPIDRTQIHLDSHLSFVARADTINVDQTLVDNVHATQAHVVEELVLYDANGGVVATYKTSDYQSNPSGYYENRWWPIGVGVIFAGLLIAYGALFVGRKKRPSPDQSAPGWPYSQIPPYPTNAPPAQNGAKQQAPKP